VPAWRELLISSKFGVQQKGINNNKAFAISAQVAVIAS
jgi:hypothetical protein